MPFPQKPGPERDKAILELVNANEYGFRLATVKSQNNGHNAEFYVFADALTIPIDGKHVRINVSAALQQAIADKLECLLPTAKIADLLWLQRSVELVPFTKSLGPNGELAYAMGDTSWMIEHSAKIDAALAATPANGGIVATVGKHWIIDNSLITRPNVACNYGWHFTPSKMRGMKGEVCASLEKEPNGQYIRLVQGRGWRHNAQHVDYSQTCVLVTRPCVVDDKPMDLLDVLANPELAVLANHDGVLKVLRQPGV